MAAPKRPLAKPDQDEPKYIDPFVYGDSGRRITISPGTNPITQLGQTTGSEFREYEDDDLNIRGMYLPPQTVNEIEYEGGDAPPESRSAQFFAEKHPDKDPLQMDDIMITLKGVENNQTAIHEFMHRGFERLRNAYDRDEVESRFGRSVANILFEPDYEHYLVQSVLEDEGIESTNNYTEGVTKSSKEKLTKTVAALNELASDEMGMLGFQTEKDSGPKTRPKRKPKKEKKSFFKRLFNFSEGGDVTPLNPKARPRTKTEEKTLRGRPVWIDHTGEVTGEKGAKYSEVTTTIPWGTEWITAPSVDENGKKLSDDEVKQRLLETRGKDFITGEELPTFSNPEKASEYAQWRSDTMFDQEAIEQGFPEEFPMGPEPERKDFIDRSLDKGKDFLEYLTAPSKHGVFNEGGDVGLPSNRLVYDVDDITRRGPEGKIKRDAAKKRVLEKYNLESARSNWKVSSSKLGTILANLPTNVRLLTEFMLGKDKPISINDFTKDELASIIALSEEQQENYKNVQNRKLKNQPENVTTVDGYDTTQPYRFSKWIENSPYFRTLAFTLTDPNYQTRTTLGRYDTEETPSSIIIKDAYDMNIKQRDLPNPFGGREELSKVLEEVRSNPEVAGEFLANIIRPNQNDSRKFDLVIPKRKPDQPSPRDTAYQVPMQLEEKPKDNPRVKEKVPEGFDILKFNKGGAVMNEQMEMAFMQQGGLKDDGMKRDPVSGNEVPNGSMAKEVRDDIPAQLSEGEYVVPADVVRYLGVKHFEDLRDKAKQGLQSMEANGRIGGEPVPVGGPQAAPMMQPPMPQAPTPYSPQPAPMAPPQMAMGGDLSPEEMNEINSIMMAQGGMVPTDPYQQQQMQYTQPMAQGAAEGADFSYYNPEGMTTEQAITTPTKFTGKFSFEEPVGITDTEVPVENEASCEARGMVYNPDTKMCEVPLEPQAPVEVGGDGSDVTLDEEGEDPTTWMDNYDYTNFNNLAQQTSAALDGSSTMLGSAAEFIFGGGVLGKFAKASNAAQVAANIAVLKAQGQDVSELTIKFNNYVDSNNLGGLKNFITGKNLAKQINKTQVDVGLKRDSKDVFDNDIFKSDDDFNKQMEKVAPKGMTYEPGKDDNDTGAYVRPGSAAPSASPKPEGGFAAAKAAAKAASNNDPGPSGAEVAKAAAKKSSPSPSYAKPSQDPYAEKRPSSSSKPSNTGSYGNDKADDYNDDSSGVYKGGLMKKKRKK